ncbi:MAG: TraM recognition domain-containing protein, partial [Bacteroidales bacterium]|nr:TraM recognition domain-containing protein [Bacteroidales bacterium]
YRQVFEVLKKFPELEVKRNTFADAIKDKALEQLQGQIASARVPLNRFASKTLYWTLSGDDFTLDINNPDEPKIICVGNNPRRQSVYGTTLAMLMSQLFKIINVPGRQHSAVLIDELPTIYLKGLDNLINTARENKVAVVIGAQDKSQLVRDYDTKESDVIFNTVGNVFAGAVKGSTADDLSRSFGKAERETRSYQEGTNNDHITYAWQLKDVLPPSKIEALSQGSFCGYVADTYQQKIHPKVFCGEVKMQAPPMHSARIPQIADLSREELELEVELNYQKIRADIQNMLFKELNDPD